MPGPGPHLMYTLAVGTGLMGVSKGRFTPHHCLIYAINAFLGPDIGSFSEWLTSTIGMGQSLGSTIMDIIHHPFYYILILGIPLSVFYSWVSKVALEKGFLTALSGVPLSRLQCLLLISAGALSHFFLDHLFEENGHSTTFTWIISTGWWEGRAPVNNEAVIVDKTWESWKSIGQISATYWSNCKPLLLMVCQSDILAKSTSTSCW